MKVKGTSGLIKLRISMHHSYKVLSYGGGVNSTALLFYLIDNDYDIDEVIFADTGAELPETYRYIRKIINYCDKNDIKFSIVMNDTDIYTWYWNHRKIPVRNRRSCSDLFKIRPIYRYLRRLNAKQVVAYLGIAYDEKKRAKESSRKYIKNVYPLVENKINREECKQIIHSHGFQIPPKSGCYFCPFQPERSWYYLLNNHPDLFKKAMLLEENGTAYPRLTLSRKKRLRDIWEEKYGSC